GGCHEEIGKFSFDIDELGTEESFESYGRGWANLSNTPFREFKSWVHEGGIATPLILHWPDYIEGENVTSTQVGHIVDLVPTILEAIGTNYPDEPGFKKPVGQSLLQVMEVQEIKHDVIFWEHEANRALRKGKWKIVAKGKEGSWELYDLKKDRSELNNQAEKKQNLVQNMAKTWDNIAREINVYPLDGRSWGERLK
ncbi:MAG: sulfatase/phosphatase domain-containing protein, partial [Halanaerobium sp.]